MTTQLPPELIDHILDHITDGQLFILKKEYSALSLVCQYWKERCQPRLFAHLTLRRRDEVYYLLDLVNHGDRTNPTHISHYIKELTLRISTDRNLYPWFHLVQLLLIPRLRIPSPMIITVIEGSACFGRSLANWMLPRAAPCPFQHIVRLELYGCSFQSFGDFLHLCHEILTLRGIICKQISWPDLTEEFPSSESPFTRLTVVDVDHCGPTSWMIARLLLNKCINNSFTSLNAEDREVLLVMLRIIGEQCEAFYCGLALDIPISQVSPFFKGALYNPRL